MVCYNNKVEQFQDLYTLPKHSRTLKGVASCGTQKCFLYKRSCPGDILVIFCPLAVLSVPTNLPYYL